MDLCAMPHAHMCHDSFICVPWIIHMCEMARSYVWHDSFIRVTWLIHMCDMTHSYLWRDSFTCVTWLIHMCDMTHRAHATVLEALLSNLNSSWHTYEWVMVHIKMSNVTNIYESRHTPKLIAGSSFGQIAVISIHMNELSHTRELIAGMRWLWLVGSLKL